MKERERDNSSSSSSSTGGIHHSISSLDTNRVHRTYGLVAKPINIQFKQADRQTNRGRERHVPSSQTWSVKIVKIKSGSKSNMEWDAFHPHFKRTKQCINTTKNGVKMRIANAMLNQHQMFIAHSVAIVHPEDTQIDSKHKL
jgi:hypothetical protein